LGGKAQDSVAKFAYALFRPWDYGSNLSNSKISSLLVKFKIAIFKGVYWGNKFCFHQLIMLNPTGYVFAKPIKHKV
jgi:hypothetical protein